MGKGSGRREGADDAAFKAATWPPESPHLRGESSDRRAIVCCVCGHPKAEHKEYDVIGGSRFYRVQTHAYEACTQAEYDQARAATKRNTSAYFELVCDICGKPKSECLWYREPTTHAEQTPALDSGVILRETSTGVPRDESIERTPNPQADGNEAGPAGGGDPA